MQREKVLQFLAQRLNVIVRKFHWVGPQNFNTQARTHRFTPSLITLIT